MLLILEGVIEYIGGEAGVCWAAMEEIADDVGRRFPFSNTAWPQDH